MVFANNYVNFPMPNTALLLDNLRPFINAHCIFNLTSAIFVVASLPVWFSSVSQILMEFTTSFLITPDITVNHLMADLDTKLQSQTT